MKRYINSALLYAVLGMAGGVFYRELGYKSQSSARWSATSSGTFCWKRAFPSLARKPEGYWPPTIPA